MSDDSTAIDSQPAIRSVAPRESPWVIGSVIVLAMISGLLGFGGWCRLTPDSFTYLDAARCLRETGGYSPFRMIAPPGYPTLLAPLFAVGDLPLLAVRLMNLACWVATSALTFLLFRRHLGTWGAWLAAALTATSPALATQSTTLLSEPVFTPLVLGCLLLLDYEQQSVDSRWTAPLALGLLCAATTLVRTMGIILAPILALAILMQTGRPVRRRARDTLVFSLAFAAPLFAWEKRQSQYPAQNNYGRAWLTARAHEKTEATGLGLQIERLRRYGPTRFRDIKSALLPPQLFWRAFQSPIGPTANVLIGGAVLVVGLWRCWRLRSAIDFFVVATLGMLCLWPYDEGTRMVAPLVPMFFAYFVWVCLRALVAFKDRPRRAAIVFVIAFGVLGLHFCELALLSRSLPHQRAKADARVAAMRRVHDWQEQHLPPSAALACITRPRQEAKTILIGGSYLAHRRIVQSIDEPRQIRGNDPAIDAAYCFIHEDAVDETAVPNDWSRLGEIEGFAVYQKSVRISPPKRPASARGGG